MKNAKIYNSFTNAYGQSFGFENYTDFAAFWFGMSLRYAKSAFPMFAKLQNAAANSKEARARLAM
jgi:hypothetical protein